MCSKTDAKEAITTPWSKLYIAHYVRACDTEQLTGDLSLIHSHIPESRCMTGMAIKSSDDPFDCRFYALLVL